MWWGAPRAHLVFFDRCDCTVHGAAPCAFGSSWKLESENSTVFYLRAFGCLLGLNMAMAPGMPLFTRARALGGLAAKQYKVECTQKEGRGEYELLMSAVSKVLESAPERKCSPRGWCDLNVAELSKGTEDRNAAARMFVRTRDDEAKRVYTIARQKLKKIKTSLKNEWLMEQLKQCNDSILPGRKDHKSGKSMWALGKKLQRGVDKWRAWGGKMSGMLMVSWALPQKKMSRTSKLFTRTCSVLKS
jgi:hypothetical protein